MRMDSRNEAAWTPLAGSYEEVVLNWFEQVERAATQVKARPEHVASARDSTRASPRQPRASG